MSGSETRGEAALRRFLKLAAEAFARHDSGIARDVTAAVREAALQSSPLEMEERSVRESPPDIAFDTKVEPTRSLLACTSFLHWRRSGYGKLPDSVSDKLRVVEVIGPHGMLWHNQIRFGVLHQQAAHLYPQHRHAAEELYFVLAGEALWSTDETPPTARPPGSFIHHKSWQPHVMETTTEPLLALWGWSGDIRADSYAFGSGQAPPQT